MELTEFNEKTAEILANLDDQGKVSVILADLTKGFTEEVSARNDAEAQRTKLEGDNQKLKEDNLNLFMRVSVKDTKKKESNPNNSIAGLFTGGKLELEVK